MYIAIHFRTLRKSILRYSVAIYRSNLGLIEGWISVNMIGPIFLQNDRKSLIETSSLFLLSNHRNLVISANIISLVSN